MYVHNLYTHGSHNNYKSIVQFNLVAERTAFTVEFVWIGVPLERDLIDEVNVVKPHGDVGRVFGRRHGQTEEEVGDTRPAAGLLREEAQAVVGAGEQPRVTLFKEVQILS